MGSKQDELEIYVQSQAFDHTVITETQWDSSHDWNAATKAAHCLGKTYQEMILVELPPL